MSAPVRPHPPSTEPAAPTAPPRPPGTLLGRLSKAVREQNAVDVCIAVPGVVIGFQVMS